MEIKYKAYSLNNFSKLPQLNALSEEESFDITVVGNVFPFKTNNYVVDELIDWSNYQNDPLFHLTFPQKEMLSKEHFDQVAKLIRSGKRKEEIATAINDIRLTYNPHPASQLEHNVPTIDGIKLPGIQHKYAETILFFPSQGQTCHAYCTFCFRWPQFVGMNELKFAMKETDLLIKYLQAHPEVTDIILTGGDPMIMSSKIFKGYIDALLKADIPNLQNIRIGSKAITFWPYKFISDKDSDELLDTFKNIKRHDKNLTFMAHFNHPNELKTEAARVAIQRILDTGCQIRTQAPIMRNINDSAEDWAEMWREQVKLGCIPYYTFIARDTGPQDYFSVPLDKCWQIFRDAYKKVSGICKTVRGPSMSADPGKVQVLGVQDIQGEKVFVLNFIQARNPEWVGRPFFAQYDPDAIWLDKLKPAFGQESFFFEHAEVLKNLNHELNFN